MLLKGWNTLPASLQLPAVRPYYEALQKQHKQLLVKRSIDVVASATLLAGLAPVLCAVGIAIKYMEPNAPILFRQQRVTQNGRLFTILKFRTMRENSSGTGVTTRMDARITPIGGLLRQLKLDELPQLWNVLVGDMTLVGARPELPQYVAQYTPAMRATLLLPAGITSAASLRYRHEERLLRPGCAEYDYLHHVLPHKMALNLDYLRRFSLAEDVYQLISTAIQALHVA